MYIRILSWWIFSFRAFWSYVGLLDDQFHWTLATVVILRARWLQNSCVFRWVKVVFFGCERWGKGGFLEDQPRCYSLNSLIFDSLTWRNWEPTGQHDRSTTLPMQRCLGAQIKTLGCSQPRCNNLGECSIQTTYIQPYIYIYLYILLLKCLVHIFSIFLVIQWLIICRGEFFSKKSPNFIKLWTTSSTRRSRVRDLEHQLSRAEASWRDWKQQRTPEAYPKMSFPEVFWSLFPCRVCLVSMKIYFYLCDHEGWSR